MISIRNGLVLPGLLVFVILSASTAGAELATVRVPDVDAGDSLLLRYVAAGS